ncbi:hypothetical protein FACS1894200_07670 [Spirochaetia bacterium]|nr:hypothetical protein FACS1894200_07670 [Spirochaetia bacterium]
MKARYESDIIAMCHEEAMGMHKLGLIDDARMREFDEMCLVPEVPPVSFLADDIPVHRPTSDVASF